MRRGPLVAGDGGGLVLRRRQRPPPRRPPAGRLAGLLPALRMLRRVGLAGGPGAEVLAGLLPRRGPRGPDPQPVRRTRRGGPHRRGRRSSPPAPARDWEQFAREHDCCLEPVLELDEALSSELVRAREMVVEIDQPGCEAPVRQLGLPVKLSRTPGDHARLPGPALGEHTEQVLAEAGYSESDVQELLAQRRRRRTGPGAQRPDVARVRTGRRAARARRPARAARRASRPSRGCCG